MLHRGTLGDSFDTMYNHPAAMEITKKDAIPSLTIPVLLCGRCPNDFGLGGRVERGAIDIFLLGGASDGRPENGFGVVGVGEGVRMKRSEFPDGECGRFPFVPMEDFLLAELAIGDMRAELMGLGRCFSQSSTSSDFFRYP